MTGDDMEYVQIKRVREISDFRVEFAEPILADEILLMHLEPCAIKDCEVCSR